MYLLKTTIGGKIMARRTKIMIICHNIDKQRDEYLEWCSVLEEHLGKKAKGFLEERRIETPFVIIDFVYLEPLYRGGYKIILDMNKDLITEEQNEDLLRLAIGEK